MKKTTILSILIILFALSSCKKIMESLDPKSDPEIINNYSGSGSRGDLLDLEINQTTKKYYAINNSSPGKEYFDYQLLAVPMNDFYSYTTNSEKCYSLEFPEKILMTTFPTANTENTLSVAMGLGHNYIDKTSQLVGDFTFITIDNLPRNGSKTIKEWGVFSMFSAGVFSARFYATAKGNGSQPNLLPENFTAQFPLLSGQLSGTWKFQAGKTENFDIHITETNKNITGIAYTDSTHVLAVISLGAGEGFLLAYKIIPNTTKYTIDGEYKFISTSVDATGTHKSFGKVVFDSKGSNTISFADSNEQLTEYTIDNMKQCYNLQNVFYGTYNRTVNGVVQSEKIYMFFDNNFIMYMSFKNDASFDFIGYGVGGRKK